MKKQFTVCTVILLSSAVFSSSSFAYSKQKSQSAHLSKFINKFDVNGDKQVTKAEFDTAMEQRFKKMDADNNGVVSKEEFKNNTKASHKKLAKNKKSKMDANNDGRISKQEYLDAKNRWAEKKFTKLDKNADGFLTEEERSADKSGKSRFKKSSHYFPKIDVNGDGVISAEENKASAERMFKKLDTNNDQVITQDEIQAMSNMRKNKK